MKIKVERECCQREDMEVFRGSPGVWQDKDIESDAIGAWYSYKGMPILFCKHCGQLHCGYIDTTEGPKRLEIIGIHFAGTMYDD